METEILQTDMIKIFLKWKIYFLVISFLQYTQLFNFDVITNESNAESKVDLYSKLSIHNTEGSGSWKTSALLNLISHHLNIEKIYLYAKDLDKPKKSVINLKTWRCGNKTFKSKDISRLFKYYG